VPRRPVLQLLSGLTVLGLALLGTPGAASAGPRAGLPGPVLPSASPVAATASTPTAPTVTVPTTCAAGVFCAGAASGDITPPVTSPQSAYTARNCAEAMAAESSGYSVDPQDHMEEGARYLLGGGPSCIGDKAGDPRDDRDIVAPRRGHSPAQHLRPACIERDDFGFGPAQVDAKANHFRTQAKRAFRPRN